MRVSVDRERCTGHARCFAAAPDVLTIDDDGYSDIGVGKPVPPELEEQVRIGVLSCPEQALTLEP